MAAPRYKSGQKAPVSGQYPVVDENGRRTGIERTAVRGHVLPPTPRKNQGYSSPDKTKTR